MRIDSPHRLFYRLYTVLKAMENAGSNKNGWAFNAQPFYNSQAHSPSTFKAEGLCRKSNARAFRRGVGV